MVGRVSAIRTQSGQNKVIDGLTARKFRRLIWGECWPCPVFASYNLAFALQLRKKHRKPSVRAVEKCQLQLREKHGKISVRVVEKCQLQLREKHGKTSVRVVEKCQLQLRERHGKTSVRVVEKCQLQLREKHGKISVTVVEKCQLGTIQCVRMAALRATRTKC